jgi:PAS domain-containing protein
MPSGAVDGGVLGAAQSLLGLSPQAHALVAAPASHLPLAEHIKLLYANSALSQLSGYSSQQLQTGGLGLLFHAAGPARGSSQAAPALATLTEALSRSQPSTVDGIEAQTGSGVRLVLRLTLTPLGFRPEPPSAPASSSGRGAVSDAALSNLFSSSSSVAPPPQGACTEAQLVKPFSNHGGQPAPGPADPGQACDAPQKDAPTQLLFIVAFTDVTDSAQQTHWPWVGLCGLPPPLAGPSIPSQPGPRTAPGAAPQTSSSRPLTDAGPAAVAAAQPEAAANAARSGGLQAFALGLVREGVVVADMTSRDCPLVYVNDAFLAMTGYSRDQVRRRGPQPLQEAPPFADAPRAACPARVGSRPPGV